MNGPVSTRISRGPLHFATLAVAAVATLGGAPARAQSLPDTVHSLTASYESWTSVWFGPLPDDGAIRATHGPAYSQPDLGPLPADADVDALAAIGPGVFWFSLADWAELVPGFRAHPGDVVQWNGAGYAKVFDLLACAFPPGLNVDAIDVSIYGGGAFMVSFDTTFLWLGSLFQVHVVFDEGYTTIGPFSCSIGDFPFYLPGTERRLDLDALAFAAPWGDPARYEPYASFDTWAALGAYAYGPGDVAYRTFAGQWQIPAYVADFGTLPARDLDALAVQLAGIFADGVETGGTSRWSATAP
jgi:hypothetical protein